MTIGHRSPHACPASRCKHGTRPNGVIEDYEYDSLNRLDTLTTFVDDGTPNGTYDPGSDTLIASFDYTLRADGKRTGVTETFESGLTNTIAWTYDNLGRLTSEDFDSTDNTLDYVHTYTFDLAGNRQTWAKDTDRNGTVDETITSAYDSNDRLLTEISSLGDTTTYGYDVTQQTSKTVTNGGSTTSSVTFAYNLQGRMQKVTTTTAGSNTETEYEYDTNGVRIKQTVTIDGAAPVVTAYLIDARNLTGYAKAIAEFVDGVLDRSYTIGPEIISQTDSAGTTQFLLHDGSGDTRLLLDLAAAVLQAYTFDAYGNAVGFDIAAALTTWLQADGQRDTTTGLNYNLARWYDPKTGRLIRLDPFFGNPNDPQSFNKYLYTHADPVNGLDPTGLSLIGGAFGGSIIGANLNDINGNS